MNAMRFNLRVYGLIINPKDEVLVSTKVGMSWGNPRVTSNNHPLRATVKVDASPKQLRDSIETSLKNLKLRTIPLVFLHNPDPKVPIEDSIGELKNMVGK